ncbi:MAG: hypothetical protein A2W93_14570 [Bacteroidetes bacterium GWF2_43_63]|nr:MAG: hypothetical protein A2W94_01140 [Bacteroidetes bacterium GWE2_42_42]OFY52565.1 MAG: hypothetical protein A2W93_14570 [Bacteroidetes bacterium GWF2_43_63]HBG71472.1 hypothetical protein [Bacteroidales bacterium]HCB60776.1 hypothetical protein [Bacteroidales bacterium]HCY23499.1 hypothetical protein [Bacteroidales bacterium]
MKTLSAIFAAFLLTIAVSAQQEKLQEVLASDTILYKIYHHLPKGWTMNIDDTSITVYRIDKYAHIESECSNFSPDSLAAFPRTETAMIHFLYEDKWESERLFWIRESNDSLNMMLGSLPQQMGVSHLYDAEKSTRSNRVYTGKTKAEKEKINAYYKRRAQLAQQITVIPTFNSSLYSLKQRRQTALKRPGICIYPFDVYKEMMGVYIILMDYCENPLEN